MRLKYWMGLVSAGLLLTGCDYNRQMPSTQIPAEQSFSLQNNQAVVGGVYPVSGEFNKIAVMGPVNAVITGHGLQNQVATEGSPTVTNAIKIWEKNQILYILNQHARPVNITLTTDHIIKQLNFLGTGNFEIKDLDQEPLYLNLSGNTHTTMRGNFVFQAINLRDHAKLNAYWVNSSHLRITTSDRAKVFLGGIVTHLDITASGQSTVNGKYLRAQDSYVTASDQARVGVNVKNALGTQSFGAARVYYYRDPELANLYLNDSGSALRMAGILNHSNHLTD